MTTAQAGDKKWRRKRKRDKDGFDDHDWDDHKSSGSGSSVQAGGGSKSSSGGGSQSTGGQGWGKRKDSDDSWARKSKDQDSDQDAGRDAGQDAGQDGSRSGQQGQGRGTARGGEDTSDGADGTSRTIADMLKAAAGPAPTRKRAPKPEDVLPRFSHDGHSRGNRSDDDVLLRRANKRGIDLAKSSGITVETTPLPGLGYDVTRLRKPPRMPSSVFKQISREALDGAEEFALKTYVIYDPGFLPQNDEEAKREKPDLLPEQGMRSGQCRDNRCYGRMAICWSGALAEKTRTIKIGMIDTPIDRDHPAFAGRRINIGSFLGDHVRSDADWHGTAVLSILAGSFDSGVPGLAPDAEFYVAETFHTDTDGVATTDTMQIVKSLEWLDSQGVHIINMSFSGPHDKLVEDAIARLHKKGVTFVASAGNFGAAMKEPSYPAGYKSVLAVTAVNKEGANYLMANRGPWIDLAAPGVDVWTALPGSKEGFRTGTSFASPFVAAILAATIPGKAPPSKADILKKIAKRDLGPPGFDPIYGHGLALASPTCADVARAPAPAPTPAQAETSSTPTPTLGFGLMTVVPEPTPASALAP